MLMMLIMTIHDYRCPVKTIIILGLFVILMDTPHSDEQACLPESTCHKPSYGFFGQRCSLSFHREQQSMIRLSGLSKPFCPMEGRSKPGCRMFFDNVSLSEFHSLHCPEQHALPYNTNEAVIQYLLASHSEPVRLSFNTNWKTFILAPCFMLLREGMPWCCLLLITR